MHQFISVKDNEIPRRYACFNQEAATIKHFVQQTIVLNELNMRQKDESKIEYQFKVKSTFLKFLHNCIDLPVNVLPAVRENVFWDMMRKVNSAIK